MLNSKELEFLSILGVTLKGTQIITDKDRLPKIAFVHKDDTVRIYYNPPRLKMFGQQALDIDPNDLISAVNQAKFKRKKGQNYQSISDFLQDDCGYNLNNLECFILNMFCISPTLVRKLYKKKGWSKFTLLPNETKLLSLADRGWSKMSTAGKNMDNEELNRCYNNMELAVKECAETYNSQLFLDYLDNYTDLQIAKGLQPPTNEQQILKVQEKFFNDVGNFRKSIDKN